MKTETSTQMKNENQWSNPEIAYIEIVYPIVDWTATFSRLGLSGTVL